MSVRKSMTRWKFKSFYIYSTTVYPDNGDYPWLLWRKHQRRRRREEAKSAASHDAPRERYDAKVVAPARRHDALAAASEEKCDARLAASANGL